MPVEKPNIVAYITAMSYHSKVSILSTIIAWTSCAIGQPGMEWQTTLGGDTAEICTALTRTSEGGYIVAGYAMSDQGDVSGNHGKRDYWIVKLDAQGTLQWQRSYGGTEDDYAYSIQQLADGGYVVAGQTYSVNGDVEGNHGGSDFWLLRLDMIGDIIWAKCYGGTNSEVGAFVKSTADGGFVLAGGSYSSDGDLSENQGSSDLWFIKLTADGTLDWQKNYGGSGFDRAFSIEQTTNQGFILAGFTESSDGDVTGYHSAYDAWIVKLDEQGDLEWERAYGGSQNDWAFEAHETPDGGYAFVGSVHSNDGDVVGNHGSRDGWLAKIGSIGAMEWQRTYGGSGYDGTEALLLTPEGYIIAGYSGSNDGDVVGSHGSTDMWISSVSPTGAIEWQSALGGSEYDRVNAMIRNSDGSILLAGQTSSNDGDVTSANGDIDYWVVKLGTSLNSIVDMTQFSMVCAPNPATDQLRVTMPLGTTGSVLCMINALGQEALTTRMDDSVSLVDVSGLPSGPYQLMLTTNSGLRCTITVVVR